MALSLVFSEHRFQSKALEMESPFRLAPRPMGGAVVGVVLRLVRRMTRRRPVTRGGMVFFGHRHQFVADLDGRIRRVGVV